MSIKASVRQSVLSNNKNKVSGTGAMFVCFFSSGFFWCPRSVVGGVTYLLGEEIIGAFATQKNGKSQERSLRYWSSEKILSTEQKTVEGGGSHPPPSPGPYSVKCALPDVIYIIYHSLT